MSNDLSEAKHKLLDKLGPSYGIYIQLLGRWFRGLISKDEFDRSAKQLIKQNFVLEHNKFWLAFFHHCANSASKNIPGHNYLLNDNGQYGARPFDHDYSEDQREHSPNPASLRRQSKFASTGSSKVRCLPSKVITHMKIFVIAWEMGLESADDHVSLYINLALQHFLKNIITELICTKTAYRLRENRFKYAIGVKSINPYSHNSLKIFSSNLEYDPYQIESNKMNSSLVDTYAYNDSLFPSRLYEAQALYEYACSTTSLTEPPAKRSKRLKFSEIFLYQDTMKIGARVDGEEGKLDGLRPENIKNDNMYIDMVENCDEVLDGKVKEANGSEEKSVKTPIERRLTLYHLLIAFLSNRTIIPSHSLYSINLERIFTKLS